MIEQGSENLAQELNLINFTKRVRMHGILWLLKLTSDERITSARLANFRPLKPKKLDNISSRNDSWEQVEGFKFWDRFQFAFLMRF